MDLWFGKIAIQKIIVQAKNTERNETQVWMLAPIHTPAPSRTACFFIFVNPSTFIKEEWKKKMKDV